MTDEGRRREAEEKLEATLNPIREAVLRHLSLWPASAAELAEALDVPIERVRYQVKRLEQAGFISPVEERRRRGTTERVYSTESRRLVWDKEEAAALPAAKVRGFEARATSLIFKEALDAMRAGAFRGRDEYSISRIPMRLDARAAGEVADALDGLLERLLDLREESLKRLRGTGEDPRPALSALLFFRNPN